MKWRRLLVIAGALISIVLISADRMNEWRYMDSASASEDTVLNIAGSGNSMTVIDCRAILGIGARLEVWNICGNNGDERIELNFPLSSPVWKLASSEKIIYTALQNGHLAALELEETSIKNHGSLSRNTLIRAMAADGNTIVTGYDDGVLAVAKLDASRHFEFVVQKQILSDPLFEQITSVSIDSSSIFAITREAGGTHLRVLELSDQNELVQVAEMNLPIAYSLASTIGNNHLFVVSYQGEVGIVDISDFVGPMEVTVHDSRDWTNGFVGGFETIDYQDGYLFMASGPGDGDKGLLLSVPEQNIEGPESVYMEWVKDWSPSAIKAINTRIIALGTGTLNEFSIAEKDPMLESSILLPSPLPLQVGTAFDTTFFGSDRYGLWHAPDESLRHMNRTLSSLESIVSIALFKEEHVLVATDDALVVTEPSSLGLDSVQSISAQEISGETNQSIRYVETSGERVFVLQDTGNIRSGANSSLSVLSPNEQGLFEVQASTGFSRENKDDPTGLAIVGNRAYISLKKSGVMILDLLDGNEISVRQQRLFEGEALAIDSSDAYLAVGTADSVRVYQALEDNDLPLVGSVGGMGKTSVIVVSGEVIYTAISSVDMDQSGYWSHITVLEIESGSVSEIDRYGVPGIPRDLHLNNGDLLVPMLDAGVSIFQVGPEPPSLFNFLPSLNCCS